MFRFRRCILLLSLALGTSLQWGPAHAQQDRNAALTVTPAFGAYFRPGHFLPLTVKIETRKQPVSGQLIVLSDTIIFRRRATLPAPSTREFTFLVAPHALYPAIEVRLLSGGRAAAMARLRTLNAVAPSAALLALLGDAPAGFTPLLNQLPSGSHLCQVTQALLPQDPRGYEAIDLLIVRDLSSRLDGPRREALTAWLQRGGRMLIIMPANGIATASPFWQTFLPAEVIGPGFQRQKLNQEMLRAAGLAPFGDPKLPGLAGFRVGLGKVLLSAYGQEPATATAESRKEIAAAIVRLLDLNTPESREDDPLLAQDVYELFEAPAWPRAARMAACLSALGYALVMAITLRVLGRERPVVFGASTVAFTAALTAVIYWVVLPGSTVVLQSASVAETRAGASALAATSYMHLGSPAEAGFAVQFRSPVKPLFFSETMLSRGPVLFEQRDTAWLCNAHLSSKPSCFEQTGIVRFSGSIEIHATNDRYEITNKASSTAANEPIVLKDVILTDGSDGVFIEELPHGKTVAADFRPDRRVRLGRLIWDTFHTRRPYRHSMLARWLAKHRPGSGVWLLGWNDLQLMPLPEGRFLAQGTRPTLWEIRAQ